MIDFRKQVPYLCTVYLQKQTLFLTSVCAIVFENDRRIRDGCISFTFEIDYDSLTILEFSSKW
jgi:hypothetical protein